MVNNLYRADTTGRVYFKFYYELTRYSHGWIVRDSAYSCNVFNFKVDVTLKALKGTQTQYDAH